MVFSEEACSQDPLVGSIISWIGAVVCGCCALSIVPQPLEHLALSRGSVSVWEGVWKGKDNFMHLTKTKGLEGKRNGARCCLPYSRRLGTLHMPAK